ncbi:hypothetical protein P154DRAFT_525726 [Amniculicola lignicola CBS 123094]|uniref:Uncharacterized protein n=1 Tax=Amniculicola lignicola CBS 123094 TaxID=1392246 RepID=A0A6A5W334_9PLEO|nr:hypothetical protein P154DRAFT_525726 [Amniculicola lignicola CBS 123094]
MKYWAEQLVKYKIGAHAPPIGFSDSKLPKAEYKGLQAPYDSDNKVKEAFVDIVTNLETYQKNTEPRKELLEDTTTSAKLLLEVINRLGIGMMKRRTAGTKLPDVEPREIIPEPAGS